MTTKTNLREEAAALVKAMKEFAITIGEQCPEGHRRDPSSGACLPMGSTDHTAFTRSLNDDPGDRLRGLKDKEQAATKEQAVDAHEMDEYSSCSSGTTFSFIQKKCVSMEEAEAEDNDQHAMAADNSYIEEAVESETMEEEVAEPAEDEMKESEGNGHESIVEHQPEGRRDPVGFHCPEDEFFDFKRRECIPLNKDTVMASEEMPADELASVLEDEGEFAAKLAYKKRKALPSSSFGVPGKRKFPLHDCNHVRNAMARFNQAKGLSPAEKSALKSKIMSRAKACGIKVDAFSKAATDADFAAVAAEQEVLLQTVAAPITTPKRKGLPASSFGVPGKRKFPLDTCARVRNAMARFNQAKGLSSTEKATLRRKILAAAHKCGIEVKKFSKAETANDFAMATLELLSKERVMKQYSADKNETVVATPSPEETAAKKQGPCPPWMEWDPKAKQCGKVKGYYQLIKEEASKPTDSDPAGRKDTEGFKCPSGYFFDFKNRKCLPLDPADKEGRQPGDTTKASSEGEKDMTPSPEGRPDRLPDDCPEGTIWVPHRRACKPLESIKASESAKIPQGGPGVGKDIQGCLPGQYFDAKAGKCLKGSNASETAGREGLTPSPAGKVRLPEDCPPDHTWDGINRLCRPIDSTKKNRPSGKSPQSPKDTATEMSVAKVISVLDQIIRLQDATGQREKSRVIARDLPNEAFPPSLVGSARRNLMHHTPEVTDAYDNASVDVARLRNALARIDKLEGYSPQAIADARAHLLFHAQEVVDAHLGKN